MPNPTHPYLFPTSDMDFPRGQEKIKKRRSNNENRNPSPVFLSNNIFTWGDSSPSFLDAGNCLWGGGMFSWTPKVALFYLYISPNYALSPCRWGLIPYWVNHAIKVGMYLDNLDMTFWMLIFRRPTGNLTNALLNHQAQTIKPQSHEKTNYFFHFIILHAIYVGTDNRTDLYGCRQCSLCPAWQHQGYEPDTGLRYSPVLAGYGPGAW